MGRLFERYAPTGRVRAGGKDVEKLYRHHSTIKPDKGKPKRHASKEVVFSGIMPDLPISAYVDPEIGADACPWLDDYIDFSHKWSPRAYDGFHVACGLWLLSTVAARRVCINMGKERFTNIYIVLAARTSIFAKSTTAEIAIQTLREAGLSTLLVSDNTTPQKFISDLAIPNITIKNKGSTIRPVSGQRGWFYEEFGQHIAAMMREGGVMSDFRNLLKRLDDTPDHYKYGTIDRGTQDIEKPYLALLANLTPDDLKPFARHGSSLWGDGFLARFAMVCPPEEQERKRDPFPKGKRRIPENTILTPLKDWNAHLDLENSAGPKILKMTVGVRQAYESYSSGLLDLMAYNENHDLDGNYTRFPEKALRTATLLASISGSDVVRMKHWSRAQEITERWRTDLHELYRQISTLYVSKESIEERLLVLVGKNHGCTINTGRQYFPRIPKSELTSMFEHLVEEGTLNKIKTRKGTAKYVFPKG